MAIPARYPPPFKPEDAIAVPTDTDPIEVGILVVGAGPAGLACAIRLGQLAEEQRRGLTIELGFAWTDIDGRQVAFVDVPGHERFVANMLAGVGPVPAVMFVVAATEGWMPQSEEHLAAVNALGVRRVLVVISKADLADPSTAIEQAYFRLKELKDVIPHILVIQEKQLALTESERNSTQLAALKEQTEARRAESEHAIDVVRRKRASHQKTLMHEEERLQEFSRRLRELSGQLSQVRLYEEQAKKSEEWLTDLADETGGRLFLPKTSEEMVAGGEEVAREIGAEYVVTYRPTKPLATAEPGEYRTVEVASRRVGLHLRSRRGYVVPTQQ